jgi:hypothetical protein
METVSPENEMKGLDAPHSGGKLVLALAPRPTRREARAGLFISGGL